MSLFVKYKVWIFILIALTSVSLLVNSCKKDNSDNVSYFLTYAPWTLASVMRQNFVGDTLKSTDTLNASCLNKQVFTFTSNNNCTYTNYHCIIQNSTGTWQLSSNSLLLTTNLTALDTVKGAVATKVTPADFQIASVINLGQYSLVLQTGTISAYYTSKTVRTIYTYGFVHVGN